MNRLGATALALLAAASLASAQPATAPAPPPLTTVVEGVIVPVPREIFATLDRFQNSNWRAVQRPELTQLRLQNDQAGIALQLGVAIAEGFIAVEAKDAEEVKNLGRAILTLARGLGVEQWALRRSRSIVDHAEKGDWAAVRQEWDGVLPDVQEGMRELQSGELAQLVSVGGWVRGTEALAALVLQNPSPSAAAVLHQPALAEQLAVQMERLSPALREQSLVRQIEAALQRLRPLVAPAGQPIAVEQVNEISAIAVDVMKAITRSR
jgi:hypothetical protein